MKTPEIRAVRAKAVGLTDQPGATALAKRETLGRNCRAFGHFVPAKRARAPAFAVGSVARNCTDNALDLAETVMQSV
ncbi:hypothetical protein [Stappia sp.]|uniref:hypothetical protein n=1 Tax=Stappia sp. TaxID=1870903 RepID=UPI003C7AF27D